MITVNFPEGINTVTAQPLYQWDYGQKLKITGAGVQVCQVHFCDRTCDETIVRVAGVTADATGIEVAIPDRLLENEYQINAFIYFCGEDTGQTVKHIHIPVIKRKRPEEYVDKIPDNVQTQIEEMLANANAAIQTIQDYYGATLTFGELYALIQDEVNTKIDNINQTTEEYWDAVEEIKEENQDIQQDLKKLNLTLKDNVNEIESELAQVDRYVPEKFKAENLPYDLVSLGVELPDGDYEITVAVAEVYSEETKKYRDCFFKCRGTKRKYWTYFRDPYDDDIRLVFYPSGTRTDYAQDVIYCYTKINDGEPLEVRVTKVCRIERG